MSYIENSEIQYIDIDKILEKRNPKLKKWLPRFMINYIKKIAHQDDINAYLDRHGTKVGRPFLEGVFEELNIHTEIIGLENLPKDRKLIFAANHPLGGIDGAAFIYEIGKFYPNIKTIINDLLLNVKNMEGIFVGVNSFGKNTREHLAGIEKMLDSDAQILMFPSGFVSRRKKGKIMDLEWRKTFIDWSRKHQRDIVPVHFSGRISNFFYNFANLRTFLGIKANLEMFYLVNEMFKHRGGKLTITIGTPIPYSTFLNTKIKADDWADYVRTYVYKLAQNPKESFSIH